MRNSEKVTIYPYLNSILHKLKQFEYLDYLQSDVFLNLIHLFS